MLRVPVRPLAGALLRRPGLWLEAVRTLVATARSGWWRVKPFVPGPDPAYLEWRIATAYGAADGDVAVEDVVAYLEWRKHQRS